MLTRERLRRAVRMSALRPASSSPANQPTGLWHQLASHLEADGMPAIAHAVRAGKPVSEEDFARAANRQFVSPDHERVDTTLRSLQDANAEFERQQRVSAHLHYYPMQRRAILRLGVHMMGRPLDTFGMHDFAHEGHAVELTDPAHIAAVADELAENERAKEKSPASWNNIRGLEHIRNRVLERPAIFSESRKSVRMAKDPLHAKLLALRPELAAAAQKFYDEWDQSDDEYGDPDLGFGGACQDIAERMGDVLSKHGIDYLTLDNGGVGEQHVWLAAHDGQYLHHVDIDPRHYETGGGYNWQKIPGVKFGPEHVDISPGHIEDFRDMIDNPDHFAKRQPVRLTRDDIPGLFEAVKTDPYDRARWHLLADALDEIGKPKFATFMRFVAEKGKEYGIDHMGKSMDVHYRTVDPAGHGSQHLLPYGQHIFGSIGGVPVTLFSYDEAEPKASLRLRDTYGEGPSEHPIWAGLTHRQAVDLMTEFDSEPERFARQPVRCTRDDIAGLFAAVQENPHDDARWHLLADALDEIGKPALAGLLRQMPEGRKIESREHGQKIEAWIEPPRHTFGGNETIQTGEIAGIPIHLSYYPESDRHTIRLNERGREHPMWATIGKSEGDAIRDEFDAPPKPSRFARIQETDCNCPYPGKVLKNGSGHGKGPDGKPCPVHMRWLYANVFGKRKRKAAKLAKGDAKKKLRDQDGYAVYTVDPFSLRSKSEPEEEFTCYGIHQDFDDIPAKEIWLADNLVDEADQILAGAIARLQALEAGKSAEPAYEDGLQAERKLRKEKCGHEYLGEDSSDPVPDGMKLREWGKIEHEDVPITVWVVDGCMVRDIFKTDFSQGGHGYVYPWIPKDEIWIEDSLTDKELPFVLEHERLERQLMNDNKLEYDDAHVAASIAEFDLRHPPVQNARERVVQAIRLRKGIFSESRKCVRLTRDDIPGLYAAIEDDPHDSARWHLLADALDEIGKPATAEVARELAGSTIKGRTAHHKSGKYVEQWNRGDDAGRDYGIRGYRGYTFGHVAGVPVKIGRSWLGFGHSAYPAPATFYAPKELAHRVLAEFDEPPPERASKQHPVRCTRDDIAGLWEAAKAEPTDKARWHLLADALDEIGKPHTAHLMRTMATIGKRFTSFGKSMRFDTSVESNDIGAPGGPEATGSVAGIPLEIVPHSLQHLINIGQHWGWATPEMGHGVVSEFDPPHQLARGTPVRCTRDDIPGLYAALADDPHDRARWHLLADALDEVGKPHTANWLRLMAEGGNADEEGTYGNPPRRIYHDLAPDNPGGIDPESRTHPERSLVAHTHVAGVPMRLRPSDRSWIIRLGNHGQWPGFAFVTGDMSREILHETDGPLKPSGSGLAEDVNADLYNEMRERFPKPAGPRQLTRSRFQRAIKLAALRDQPVSTGGASARVHSLNHDVLVRVAKDVLDRSGLAPNKVYPAIQDTGGQARAAIVAAVFGERRPHAAEYGAAWQGLIAHLPGLVIFRSHPQGADSVYRFAFKGPVATMGKLLDKIGVTSRVFVPQGEGTHVFLYDRGRGLRQAVGGLASQIGLEVTEHTGNGTPIGGGDDMGRGAYRDEIRRQEYPVQQQRAVRMTRDDIPGLLDSIRRNPHDPAHWHLFADAMDEIGKPNAAQLARDMAGLRPSRLVAIPSRWGGRYWVAEFVPHQTKRGHWVWQNSRTIASGTFRQLENRGYTGLEFGSLHNKTISEPLQSWLLGTGDAGLSPADGPDLPADYSIKERPIRKRFARSDQPVRCTRDDIPALLEAARKDPHNDANWLILADALDEIGKPATAEFLRMAPKGEKKQSQDWGKWIHVVTTTDWASIPRMETSIAGIPIVANGSHVGLGHQEHNRCPFTGRINDEMARRILAEADSEPAHLSSARSRLVTAIRLARGIFSESRKSPVRMTRDDIPGLFESVKQDPTDRARWHLLADALDEIGKPHLAGLLRWSAENPNNITHSGLDANPDDNDPRTGTHVFEHGDSKEGTIAGVPVYMFSFNHSGTPLMSIRLSHSGSNHPLWASLSHPHAAEIISEFDKPERMSKDQPVRMMRDLDHYLIQAAQQGHHEELAHYLQDNGLPWHAEAVKRAAAVIDGSPHPLDRASTGTPPGGRSTEGHIDDSIGSTTLASTVYTLRGRLPEHHHRHIILMDAIGEGLPAHRGGIARFETNDHRLAHGLVMEMPRVVLGSPGEHAIEINRLARRPERMERAVRMTRDDIAGLHQAVVEDPHDKARWLLLADALDEIGKPHTASLMRDAATAAQPEGTEGARTTLISSRGFGKWINHVDMDFGDEPIHSRTPEQSIAGIPVHTSLGLLWLGEARGGKPWPLSANISKEHADRILSEADEPTRMQKPVRCTRDDIPALMENVRLNPGDRGHRLLLADALDEVGRVNEAEALRSNDQIEIREPHASNPNHRIDRRFRDYGLGRFSHSWFPASTPTAVMNALHSRLGRRVHISLGDPETGRDRLEEHELHGDLYMPVTQRIFLNPIRGGYGSPISIFAPDIVRIRDYPQGAIVYQHPSYHHGEIGVRPISPETIAELRGRGTPEHVIAAQPFEVTQDGKWHALFRSERAARMWARKLGLTVTEPGQPEKLSARSRLQAAIRLARNPVEDMRAYHDVGEENERAHRTPGDMAEIQRRKLDEVLARADAAKPGTVPSAPPAPVSPLHTRILNRVSREPGITKKILRGSLRLKSTDFHQAASELAAQKKLVEFREAVPGAGYRSRYYLPEHQIPEGMVESRMDQAAGLKRKGLSDAAIAEELGLAGRSARGLVARGREKGVLPPKPPVHERVAELYRSGLKGHKIARQLGITPQAVYDALKRARGRSLLERSGTPVRCTRDDIPGLLENVKANPHDDAHWLLLADALDEIGKPATAELMRHAAKGESRAGTGNVVPWRVVDLFPGVSPDADRPMAGVHIAGIPMALRDVGNQVHVLGGSHSARDANLVAYIPHDFAHRILAEADEPTQLARDGQPVRMSEMPMFAKMIADAAPGDRTPALLFSDWLAERGYQATSEAIKRGNGWATEKELPDNPAYYGHGAEGAVGEGEFGKIRPSVWIAIPARWQSTRHPAAHINVFVRHDPGRHHNDDKLISQFDTTDHDLLARLLIEMGPDDPVSLGSPAERKEVEDFVAHHLSLQHPERMARFPKPPWQMDAGEIEDVRQSTNNKYFGQGEEYYGYGPAEWVRPSDYRGKMADEGKELTTGWQAVRSSWISGVRRLRGTSTVEFMVKKGGHIYAYPNCPPGVYQRWIRAQSPGKFWHAVIRGHLSPAVKKMSAREQMLVAIKMARR